MNDMKLQIVTHDDKDTLNLLKQITLKKNTSKMIQLNIKVNGKPVCLVCLDHHDSQGGHNGACPGCGEFLDKTPTPWH